MSTQLLALNARLTRIETILNVTGWIPFVGSASSCLRAAYGNCEIIMGVALAAIALCTHGIKEAWHRFGYAFHGFANIVRAAVELPPFYGNLICFIYDSVLRMSYPGETVHLTAARRNFLA